MSLETPTSLSPAPWGSWRREIAIAAGALAFGLVALPPAIYLVGQRMLGDYQGEGALGLSEAVWTDLLSLRLPALLLVLSPYVVLQLTRAVHHLMRSKP